MADDLMQYPEIIEAMTKDANAHREVDDRLRDAGLDPESAVRAVRLLGSQALMSELDSESTLLMGVDFALMLMEAKNDG